MLTFIFTQPQCLLNIFEIIENQPIYSIAPDFDNEIPREIDNPIFTHNEEEENQTDTNTFFSQPITTNIESNELVEENPNIAQSLPLLNNIKKKPCIKKISNKKVKFDTNYTAIDENGTFSYEAIQDKYTLGNKPFLFLPSEQKLTYLY